MSTKRNATTFALALLLIFTSACGAAATPRAKSKPVTAARATAAPATAAPALPFAAAPQAPAAQAMPMNQPKAVLQPAPTMASGLPALGIQPPASIKNPNNQSTYDTFFQNYGVNPRIDTGDDPLIHLRPGCGYRRVQHHAELYQRWRAAARRLRAGGRVCQLFQPGLPLSVRRPGFRDQYRRRTFAVRRESNLPDDAGRDPGLRGPSEEERKDVSLTFVIDVSGSMDMDNRLGLVKRSLGLLVKQLRPSDRVSIVVYGTNAEVVLEPTAGDRTDQDHAGDQPPGAGRCDQCRGRPAAGIPDGR